MVTARRSDIRKWLLDASFYRAVYPGPGETNVGRLIRDNPPNNRPAVRWVLMTRKAFWACIAALCCIWLYSLVGILVFRTRDVAPAPPFFSTEPTHDEHRNHAIHRPFDDMIAITEAWGKITASPALWPWELSHMRGSHQTVTKDQSGLDPDLAALPWADGIVNKRQEQRRLVQERRQETCLQRRKEGGLRWWEGDCDMYKPQPWTLFEELLTIMGSIPL